MKQNTKIQLGLEDPKQANHPLGFYPPTKGRLWGIQKGAESSCVSRGLRVAAPQSFWWHFSFYKCRAKALSCATLKSLKLQKLLAPFWIPPASLSWRIKAKWMVAYLGSPRPS